MRTRKILRRWLKMVGRGLLEWRWKGYLIQAGLSFDEAKALVRRSRRKTLIFGYRQKDVLDALLYLVCAGVPSQEVYELIDLAKYLVDEGDEKDLRQAALRVGVDYTWVKIFDKKAKKREQKNES